MKSPIKTALLAKNEYVGIGVDELGQRSGDTSLPLTLSLSVPTSSRLATEEAMTGCGPDEGRAEIAMPG